MEDDIDLKIVSEGFPSKVYISCSVAPTEIEEQITEVTDLLPYAVKRCYKLDETVFPRKDTKIVGNWCYMLRLYQS